MNKEIRDLERLALQAHRRGDSWADFQREHGDAIRRAEPWHIARYRRLVQRLMALVTSGDGKVRATPPWEEQPERQLRLPLGGWLVAVPGCEGRGGGSIAVNLD